jgi:hypothetical protein
MLVASPIEVENFGLNGQRPKQNISRIVSTCYFNRFIIFVKLFCIGFLRCCGSCPFASLLAFLLTLTGTGICCGCLYYPLRATIEQVNNVFEIEYIDYDW